MNNEFRDAAIFGDVEKVKSILITNPECIHEKDKYGFTALHEAVGEDSLEMVKTLIIAGADINAQNDEGIAPLHLAAYDYIAKALIDSGADIELKAMSDATPLLIQAENPESIEVMETLLDCGANPAAKNSHGFDAFKIAHDGQEHDKLELLKKYAK